MEGMTAHEAALAAADGGRRAREIQAHRNFADFLTQHTTVPIPNIAGHEYLVLRGSDTELMAEVDRIAGELGVTAHWHRGRYEARRSWGNVTYDVVCMPRVVPAGTGLAA